MIKNTKHQQGNVKRKNETHLAYKFTKPVDKKFIVIIGIA